MKRTSDIILTTLSLSFLFLFGFQYLSAWTEPTLAPPAGNITSSGAFQETTSVTQQGDTPGYDEDFVFGSPSLDYDSDANHASRMFFDEGTGAFRAGYNNTTSWNNANVGSRSASFGYNTRAAGTYSFSAGYYAEAWSSHSIALGYNTDAYYGASAIGFGADSYGNYSTALGNYAYTNSAAPYSTAIGYYAKSYDDYAVTIGKYVRNDTMNSIMLGIGTANPAAQTTDPGIFINSSNNVGIGTVSPGAKLHIKGGAVLLDDNQPIQMRASDSSLQDVMKLATDDALEIGKGSGVSSIDIFPAGDFGLRVFEGRVGIGATPEANQLEVEGNVAIGAAYAGTAIYGPTNGLLVQGNVGIGTTNPQAKLHIGGTAGVDGIKFPDGTLQTTAASGGGWTFISSTSGNFSQYEGLPSGSVPIPVGTKYVVGYLTGYTLEFGNYGSWIKDSINIIIGSKETAEVRYIVSNVDFNYVQAAVSGTNLSLTTNISGYGGSTGYIEYEFYFYQ